MNSIENNLAENLLILNNTQKSSNSVLASTTASTNYRSQQSRQYHNLNYDDVNSVRDYALESCREYLGGIWKKIRNNQFQIEKIS